MPNPELTPGDAGTRPPETTLHEFRNIVFALGSLVDGLHAKAGALPDVQRYLPRLKDEIARLSRFALPATPAPLTRTADLAGLVRAAERSVRALADERRVSLVSTIPGGDWDVALDPVRGEDAVAVLLAAVLRATAGEGTVRLELARAADSAFALTIEGEGTASGAESTAPGLLLAMHEFEARGGTVRSLETALGPRIEVRLPAPS